ncbi:MAG: hypothetical protein ACLFQV_10275 [Vulcanimicrobiota bacterium]
MKKLIIIMYFILVSGFISNASECSGIVKPGWFKAGNKWTYVSTKGRQKEIINREIVQKKEINGVEVYQVKTLTENKPETKNYYNVMVRKDGVVRYPPYKKPDLNIAGQLKQQKPIRLVLRLPIQIGDKWNWKINSKKTGVINTDFEVLGYETITVPAGSFETYKIKRILNKDNQKFLIYKWMNSRVGLVRYQRFQINQQQKKENLKLLHIDELLLFK